MLSVEEKALVHMRVTSGSNAVQNILSHISVGSGDGDVYDAAKAHEYYLRNRKLKGRTKGNQKVPIGRSRGLPTGSKQKKKSTAQLSKERAVIKGRVASLQAKLAQLKKVLAELVKQAKEKSGIKTKATTKDAATSTAAKKAAADKSSKEYYEKNKEKIAAKAKKEAANNNATDLEAQIKEIQAKIAVARAELAAAIKR